jgi:uncharacterized protein with PIN domain
MSEANFRFYGELNDFLTNNRKGKSFSYEFDGNPSVKNMIEALGVPHPEVYAIQANERFVDFSYHGQHGDRIRVYPVSYHQRLPEAVALQEPVDGEPRFVLDLHLGRLAAYMRMMGFDVLYRNDFEDPELARIASEQGRILLTRDRRLLMRNRVSQGYCLRSLDPERQLVEVLERYDLSDQVEPFRRCLRCNTPLVPVSKEKIVDRLEPLTKRYFNEFHICPNCKQIYWKGSHFHRMQRLIDRLLEENH